MCIFFFFNVNGNIFFNVVAWKMLELKFKNFSLFLNFLFRKSSVIILIIILIALIMLNNLVTYNFLNNFVSITVVHIIIMPIKV